MAYSVRCYGDCPIRSSHLYVHPSQAALLQAGCEVKEPSFARALARPNTKALRNFTYLRSMLKSRCFGTRRLRCLCQVDQLDDVAAIPEHQPLGFEIHSRSRVSSTVNSQPVVIGGLPSATASGCWVLQGIIVGNPDVAVFGMERWLHLMKISVVFVETMHFAAQLLLL